MESSHVPCSQFLLLLNSCRECSNRLEYLHRHQLSCVEERSLSRTAEEEKCFHYRRNKAHWLMPRRNLQLHRMVLLLDLSYGFCQRVLLKTTNAKRLRSAVSSFCVNRYQPGSKSMFEHYFGLLRSTKTSYQQRIFRGFHRHLWPLTIELSFY